MTFTYAYEPVKGDLVIGTVKIKSADYYILDIGAPLDGTLGAL
jgi:exosome complex RNA-binding protein Rrp4